MAITVTGKEGNGYFPKGLSTQIDPISISTGMEHGDY